MTTISAHEVKALAEWLGGESKDGSTEDLEGRRALAKVLRHGPLDLGVRCMLANLIDPDTTDDAGVRLVFKRAPGRARTMDRRRVAAIIWHEIRAGIKKESAVARAMGECNVSRSKALEAYKEWKPAFEKYGSKLKALTRTD
jgi:hypothetical protein